MNNGLCATIIGYRNWNDIDIQFENGAIVNNEQYGHFERGNIKCPMLIRQIDDYAEVINVNIDPVVTFMLDVEDLPALGKWLWFKDSKGYIVRNANPGTIRLHRVIMNAPLDMDVDHKDGNKPDCRKRNLRICTKAENTRNRAIPNTNTSGYKGVNWDRQKRKWRAKITANEHRNHIGYYDTAKEAARAYNEAALKYHGEFARLNEI